MRHDREGIDERPFALVAAVLVSLRVFAVIGLQLRRYVDSIEYDTLDFSGRWRRPWTTPLLYTLVKDRSDAWTVLLQAILGGLAWAGLAVALAAHLTDRRARIGAMIAIGALSVTTTVTNWDTAKLSESIAISLTIALIAVWLRFLHRPGFGRAAAIIAVATPWLFVRQSLLATAWVLTIVAVITAIIALRRGPEHRREAAAHGIVAISLLVLCGIATLSYSRNQEIAHTNLTAMITNRIAHDPGHLAWFVDHGMILPPGGSTAFGDLEADPGFQRWLRDDGGSTYVRFLAEHPWFSLTAPIPDLFEQRVSFLSQPPYRETIEIETEAMLAPRDAYGIARPLLPGPVEAVLLDPGHTGSITLLTIGTAAWGSVALVRRRRSSGRLALGPLPAASIVLALLAWFGLWSAWHGATTELPRLGLVPALTLRIAVVSALAALVDHTLRAAYPRPG